MRESLVGGLKRAAELVRSYPDARLVPVVGALMIAAQLVFRAWAVYPAWFFLDDYNILVAARHSGLTPAYLLDPYSGHVWPGGRLIVWLVAQTGSLNWAVCRHRHVGDAAGRERRGAVDARQAVRSPQADPASPSGMYLTSALTMPAFMWWVAALTLLPVQIAFFVAATTWVKLPSQPTDSGR